MINISVITTVKNGEAFLLETLQSVYNQTYKDYEHIIVDDGSTDNTVTIIKRFQEDNPSYKVCLYQPGNLGRGKALNYAVSKASADWIAIIDADDIWHPQKLEIQYMAVQKDNIDILATGSDLFRNSREVDFSQKGKEEKKIIFFSMKNMLKSNKIVHSSVLIKKDLCIYDEQRKSQYDYELWLRLINQNKNLAKISPLLNFNRVHANQSFESKMGRVYAWRAFKLNSFYAIKSGCLRYLPYATLKLLARLTLSKSTINSLLKR